MFSSQIISILLKNIKHVSSFNCLYLALKVVVVPCALKNLFPVDYEVGRTGEIASFTYFLAQKTCPH